MEQIRLSLYILLIGSVFSGIVLLISKFEKKNSLPKYVPAIILFAAGVASIAKSIWFSEGMEGLAYIIISILVFSICIMALLTAILIGIYKSHKNKNQ